MEKTIGFIGAGNMAGAIIGGMIQTQFAAPSRIVVSAPTDTHLSKLQGMYGMAATHDNQEVARQADIVVLCVKPHQICEVIAQIKGTIQPDALVVSIAAGVRLERMEAAFGKPVHLARAMPNTPCLVGEGMTAIFPGRDLTPDQTEKVCQIFGSVGKVEVLDEGLADAVGAVSGSSPAYVYLFIEAMADAAVKGGMKRQQAYRFAAQAVLGAAKMVLETQSHPAALKDAVCSPGGSTIEAIEKLEQGGFRGAVFSAMDACMKKTAEMSRQ